MACDRCGQTLAMADATLSPNRTLLPAAEQIATALQAAPVLTSASVHDSQAAIPLATITAQRVTHLYDLMNAA